MSQQNVQPAARPEHDEGRLRWLWFITPLLVLGTTLALGASYRHVEQEALAAYQSQQLAAVQVIATRVGGRIASLVSASRGIDLFSMPEDHRGAWLEAQAERFGVVPGEAQMVVTGADGALIASTAEGGPPAHDHLGAGTICSLCRRAGALVLTSAPDLSGRVLTITYPTRQLRPLLQKHWGWLTDAHGEIVAHADTAQIGTRPFATERDDEQLTRMRELMAGGASASATYVWTDPLTAQAERRVASFAPVPGAPRGWSLAVSVSEDQALAGVTGALYALIWATIGLIAIVGTLGGLALLQSARAHRHREALANERLLMTQAAAHSERLALLGGITAGVAHDLASPLTALRSTLEYLEEEICRVDEEAFEDLRLASLQLVSLTADLNSFSKTQATEESCEVGRAARIAVRLLGPTLRSSCAVEVEIPELPSVRISERRLTQILMNLLTNASQVAETVWVRAAPDGEGAVVLTVEDDGPGIPDAIAPSVFEPFFTTKSAEQGTGLGLHLCRRYLDDAGGSISLERGEAGGARFRLRLGANIQPRRAVG